VLKNLIKIFCLLTSTSLYDFKQQENGTGIDKNYIDKSLIKEDGKDETKISDFKRK
jgi:hypothetical protein